MLLYVAPQYYWTVGIPPAMIEEGGIGSGQFIIFIVPVSLLVYPPNAVTPI